MKKTSVIMIIILFALVLAIAVGIIPFAMISNSINTASTSKTDAYMSAYNDLINNTSISDGLKKDAVVMNGTMEIALLNVFKSECGIIVYLLVAISVIFILFGVYFIKNKECKNYIGTIFIVAACILLAFTAIIGFQFLRIDALNFI